MSVIQNFLLATPEGYQISRSVRLRSSASAYFNRTPASTTNRRTWTWSAWAKRGSLGAARNLLTAIGSSRVTYITFTSADKLTIYSATSAGGGDGGEYASTQVFRDPSAWYHIVVAYDSTQATSTNRIKAFINGIQITSWSTSTTPTLNHDTQFNWTGAPMQLGAYNASQFFDGYLTEVNFIDGQALDASYFGETDAVTGVWKPKKYAGTYGTNGFYLNFSDNSAATAAAIGKDYSGNGNDWTPNNISVTSGVTYDSMLDVPTQWADGGNGRGNYAVLNPIDPVTTSTFSEGNLKYTNSTNNRAGFGTPLPSAGKWYWELIWTTNGGSSSPPVGICAINYDQTANGRLAYRPNGNKMDQAGTETAYGSTWTVNDVIGVAVDLDSGKIWFAKNGTWQNSGDPAAGTNAAFTTVLSAITNPVKPMIQVNVAGDVLVINFGQRPFTYTPPSGFKALNTLNLPQPTILKGEQYMNATLWSGNSTNARVITTTLGTVDFAWVKRRNGVDDHRLANTVTGGNRHLKSNSTDAESTGTTVIQAFSGSTFTLGTDGSVNATGGTYVGWTWQAGGAAVTNTAGSISSQVSAGGTQGFSVVTYTGTGANATVGHGLGVAPKMIIFRARSIVENWPTWHTNLTSAAFVLTLNTTNAQASVPQVMNSTAPTSSVFSVGTSTGSNGNGTTYVAYLFSEVAGFSKFGSYTGNGSADGTFVFCGFRPKFVMVKRTDSVGSWWMLDSARDTFNLATKLQRANEPLAEETSYASIDMLSNGFKLRVSSTESNASGGTYIFAAFAENPTKFALAR